MGMNAQVIAIGPYDPKIDDLMDYEGNSAPEGKETVVTLFICNTTNQSRELAEGCNLKNALQNTSVDIISFNCVSGAGDMTQVQTEYEILKRFGFKFYYMANG